MTGLRYEGVRFAYPDDGRDQPWALDDLTLDVGDGEVTVVAGSSGSGKSTFLRAANGLVPHATGGRFGGQVLVGDRSTRDAAPRDLADLVGFVHQDPQAHAVVDRVEGDVAFVLENLGVEPLAMRRRVEEVLDALGIAHLRHRSLTTLSGGERQRCAVAAALAAGPSVLVLDEPTSELDPQGADDVFAALTRLNHDLGTTILVAEHRLERVAAIADRALVLEDGRVQADGPPAETLVDYPGAPPVTQLGRLLGWQPLPLTVRDARARARQRPPELTPPAPAGATSGAAGETLLASRGLGVDHGSVSALRDVEVTVSEGAVVALLGRNGSGKTTLLRSFAGLQRPARGDVVRDAPVAFVPQDPNALLFASTVRAELEETLRLRRIDDPARVDRWLERLGLAPLAERHPRSLSAGQRQRVAVAAVAVAEPRVLLLDEPTRGIDAHSRDVLEGIVGDQVAGGGAVVLATHDVELAARCATEVVVLGEGEIVASGPAATVLAGSLFAPQVLRVLPPYLTVAQVARALEAA